MSDNIDDDPSKSSLHFSGSERHRLLEKYLTEFATHSADPDRSSLFSRQGICDCPELQQEIIRLGVEYADLLLLQAQSSFESRVGGLCRIMASSDLAQEVKESLCNAIKKQLDNNLCERDSNIVRQLTPENFSEHQELVETAIKTNNAHISLGIRVENLLEKACKEISNFKPFELYEQQTPVTHLGDGIDLSKRIAAEFNIWNKHACEVLKKFKDPVTRYAQKQEPHIFILTEDQTKVASQEISYALLGSIIKLAVHTRNKMLGRTGDKFQVSDRSDLIDAIELRAGDTVSEELIDKWEQRIQAEFRMLSDKYTQSP